MQMLTKGLDVGFKDVDLKQGIVTGQFAKHNTKDLGGDISEQGVFAKSIMERGPKGSRLMKFLLDHDKKMVPGVLTDVYEDAQTASYEMKAGTHNQGVDFVKMVESGIINQHSYGYVTIKEMYDGNRKANILKEVMLLEVSAIQFLGMNPDTTRIDLKSEADAFFYLEKLKRFLQTSDCTDETLSKLELEFKSLELLLKPSKDTLKELEADQYKSLINILKS
jgi:hypothetical protein